MRNMIRPTIPPAPAFPFFPASPFSKAIACKTHVAKTIGTMSWKNPCRLGLPMKTQIKENGRVAANIRYSRIEPPEEEPQRHRQRRHRRDPVEVEDADSLALPTDEPICDAPMIPSRTN